MLRFLDLYVITRGIEYSRTFQAGRRSGRLGEKMKKIGFLWFLVVVASCASAPGNLQRETARVLGDVSPDAVTVSNVDRGITSVKWDAATPKGPYACSSDDMLRRPYCVKKQ